MNEPSADPTLSVEENPPVTSVALPVWLFVLLGMLGYGGMLFLDQRAGGFHPQVYEPYPSLAYVNAMQPKSGSDLLFSLGERVYSEVCTQCHMPDGKGDRSRAIPPLVGSDWVQAEAPGRIIRLILDGLQGPIVVSGEAFSGATTMPPWRDTLSDQRIAAVATFIRQNKRFNNAASAVTPEQVADIRAKTADRANIPWLPANLEQVPLTE